MPGKGKHRRPKSRSISRGLTAAGTGGAALALPLIGATGAHAAPAAAPATAPAQAPQAPAALPAAATVTPTATPTAAAAAVYTVVAGDHLSKIAAERRLTGGWEQLYADNRDAVGSDPSLIHPGLKLTLGAPGSAEAAPAPAAPAPTKKQSAPSASTPDSASGSGSGNRSERSSSRPEASGERSSAPKAAPKKAAPAQKPAGSGQAAPSTPSASGGFVAPVAGGVSTAYRMGGSMWSSGYHTGVDFMASTGTTVKAVGAGTVVSAGWGGSYGNEVVIRHADGKYSQYAHLSSLSVSAGQSVTGGQRVGLSGATGNVTGPHLHFEIRTGPSYGSDIDPLGYLRSKGVSL
ncbi:peptidoglycan DD-metalloendopeptidase family protein [Streptomyces sp. NPDC058623]|uniref:peptidoglycan DD-metalloendopeptidase family protein n=1 Tax=Streptomyces sp. NPDC058623 TaxID=3346563 RepID=UPI0036587A20